MSFEMRPRTEPVARLLAAIRDVAPLLSERAEAADRNNQLCEQSYRDIQAAGIAGAFVPEELGGIGLQSMHDCEIGCVTSYRQIGVFWVIALTSYRRSIPNGCEPTWSIGSASS